MFLMSSCKKNTLLMNTLCNFVWEMFGKLMEYTNFPTQNYIMYLLVRYSTHQKHHVFLAGIQNVFHASSKPENFWRTSSSLNRFPDWENIWKT